MMLCPICTRGNANIALEITRDGKDWDIYECPECLTQFVHPIPPDEELRQLYKDYYTKNRARLKELINPRYGRLSFPRQWGIINGLVRKEQGSILDFGCGGGHFLDRVSKRWQKYGIDISNEARAIAEQKSITTFGSVDEVRHWDNYFDVITMFATIEHLPNPRETLSQLIRLLKVGGLLVVMTGDVGSLKAVAQGERWPLYAPPGHLYYFTAYSLDSLAESLGCNKIKHLYTDGGMTSVPFMPLNLMLRVGIEVYHRMPYLNTLPLFDTYYGYYQKGRE